MIKPRTPDRIVRNGVVYEKSAFSRWDELLEEAHQEAEEASWPPAEEVGAPISPRQRLMLHRIAACPTPMHWGGMGWQTGGMSKIPYAPHIPAVTMRCLWKRGLLMLDNVKKGRGHRFEPTFVRLSTRGQATVSLGLLEQQRLWWLAIEALSKVIAQRWQTYRDNGCPPEQRPYDRPTEAEISEQLSRPSHA